MKRLFLFGMILALCVPLCACAAGKSSYELAVDEGFDGTLSQWLESLRGQDGENGKPGADGKTSLWHSGNGSPDFSLGNEGDYYLDFKDGSVYEKSASGWEQKGSLHFDSNLEQVTVTFDAGEGELPIGEDKQRTVRRGGNIRMPVPTREGYVFLGWFTGDGINAGQATDLTPFTRDVFLIAKWRREYSLSLTAHSEGVIGQPVSFIGSYNGTARALFEVSLEKDGQRKIVSEAAAWCGESRLQVSEMDDSFDLFGTITFLEEGTYTVAVTAEEDGIPVEAEFTVTVIPA